MSDDKVNGIGRLVTYDEFGAAMDEQVENISDIMSVVNALKLAINVQAEAIAAQQYVLTTIIPPERLKYMLKEFKEERQRQILTQNTPAANA